MKVRNLINANGNAVANQFVIEMGMEDYAPGTLYRIKQEIPSYKSFSDMLRKAIKKGIIQYDGEMV